ncbi:MAG: YceI family protein [Actinomycetes bacterium]
MSALATETLIPAGTWTIDPAHSQVGFSVKHLGIATVRGTFDRFAGTLEVGDDLAAAKIVTTIETASVNTNDAQRDAHLRAADFFDAEANPELRFESTEIRQIDAETFSVAGDLTLRGVTQPVELKGVTTGFETDPWANERVGVELTGELSRGDFGITFNQLLGSGNALVSDKVKLSLDISAIRKA